MYRAAVIALVLSGYAVLTHRYVPVWQSEATLWAHAIAAAPWRPRGYVNYGVVAMGLGELDLATRAFDVAETLAQQPHIPAWDRERVLQAIAENRQWLQGRTAR